MVKALIFGAIAWPVLLGGALVARVHQEAPAFSAVLYLAGSRVCHQREERSFHWHGAKWPVCGRCSGLYIGGLIGAVAAASRVGRQRQMSQLLVWLALASIPTAITVVLEWSGLASVTNTARAIAALPVGAFVMLVIVRTAAGPRGAIE
jgi:uncharacterized membrane protein